MKDLWINKMHFAPSCLGQHCLNSVEKNINSWHAVINVESFIFKNMFGMLKGGKRDKFIHMFLMDDYCGGKRPQMNLPVKNVSRKRTILIQHMNKSTNHCGSNPWLSSSLCPDSYNYSISFPCTVTCFVLFESVTNMKYSNGLFHFTVLTINKYKVFKYRILFY